MLLARIYEVLPLRREVKRTSGRVLAVSGWESVGLRNPE